MLSAVSRPVLFSPAQSATPAAAGSASATDQLSEEQQKQVDELKARDAEVRAHERAHANAGGAFAGSPSFTMTTGPDGRSYAIGGEVHIDTSPEKDPDATAAKMNVIIAAALAPAEPSGQDRAVAAAARQALASARAEEASGETGASSQEASVSAGREISPANARQASAVAAYDQANQLTTYGGVKVSRTNFIA